MLIICQILDRALRLIILEIVRLEESVRASLVGAFVRRVGLVQYEVERSQGRVVERTLPIPEGAPSGERLVGMSLEVALEGCGPYVVGTDIDGVFVLLVMLLLLLLWR